MEHNDRLKLLPELKGKTISEVLVGSATMFISFTDGEEIMIARCDGHLILDGLGTELKLEELPIWA